MISACVCVCVRAVYPSIIRAHNLCWSTLVLSDDVVVAAAAAAAGGATVAIETIETHLGTYRWAQGGRRGVLPTMLEKLAAMRKSAKGDLADAKRRGDTFLASLFDAKQAAIKVVMNSAYGFTGAAKGYLPCVPIAISVTTIGRAMIEKTRRMAETLVPDSQVIYGDTDSVFVKLSLPSDAPLAAHFEIAEKLAEDISATFLPPIKLEFEKVYRVLLLIGKKRYAGLKLTSPDEHPVMDTKGLQLCRRDSVPLARETSAAVLDAFLWRGSVDAAMRCAKDAVLELVSDLAPFEKLVLSKQLRGSYANPESQPHWRVAQNIYRRTGQRVPSGSRVPYVIIRAPEFKGDLVAARAEDPTYATTNGLRLDVLHYLESHMLTPLLTLLTPMLPDADARAELLGEPEIAERIAALRELFDTEARDIKRVRTNAANKQHPITAFFTKKYAS